MKDLDIEEIKMSAYGYLICEDCKVRMWLGKSVKNNNNKISHFHIGDSNQQRNWQNDIINRVIWKIFAEHVNHSLRVVTDNGEFQEEMDDYSSIADENNTIDYSPYLSGWPG